MTASGESLAALAPTILAVGAVSALSSRLPAGADPDAVRDWFELETIVELPAPALSFAEAEAAAADYRRAARADNTGGPIAPRSPALPTGVTSIARPRCRRHPRPSRRFSRRRRAGASPSTPCGCVMPRCAICISSPAIRRRPPRRWCSDLCRYSPRPPPAVAQKDRPRARTLAGGDQGVPDTLPGLRDRALILVGFAAALRPVELARLDIASLTRHEDGIALFLPWRKNDQEAQGTTVWLPVGQTDLCPVTALEAWLAAAEISDGPLFRRLWRLPPPRVPKAPRRKPVADHYRIGTNPIDADSIALVIKKWTGLAGLDSAAFAGHSLRRGAISSGVAQGVHIARLKQFSGHASLKSLEEYVELDELRHIIRSRTSSEGTKITTMGPPGRSSCALRSACRPAPP